MAKYNIYLVVTQRCSIWRRYVDAGLDPADQHVEYAAPLKNSPQKQCKVLL